MADLLGVDVPRRLEYVALEDLVPDERNPKAHDLEELRASMGRWGYTQPVELDERTGKMVAGHGRRELLLDDIEQGREAPEGVVVGEDGRWYLPVVRGWSSVDDDEAWAYIVAANRIGERAGWDYERLVPGLQLLAERPAGLEGVGFRPTDMSDLVGRRQRERDQARERQTDPDEVPAVPAKPHTKVGDVWLCGPHRIACGDSTDPDLVAKALGGASIDMVFSSPPYNVGVNYEDSSENDGGSWDDYEPLLRGVVGVLVPHLAKGRALCWNVGVSPKTHVPRQTLLLEELGLSFFRQLVWQKVGVAVPLWHNTREHRVARQFTPNYQHELVLVFTKGELKRGGPTDFDNTLEHDVFRLHQSASSRDIPTDQTKGRTGNQSNLDRRSRKAHPAPFPVDLPRAFIAHLCDVGGVVYDPFVGVGSTVIACHATGRVGVGIDLSPQYVDVACERWQRHTGEVPVLESTGKAHSFVRQ